MIILSKSTGIASLVRSLWISSSYIHCDLCELAKKVEIFSARNLVLFWWGLVGFLKIIEGNERKFVDRDQ